jgi:hypothetical protein
VDLIRDRPDVDDGNLVLGGCQGNESQTKKRQKETGAEGLHYGKGQAKGFHYFFLGFISLF